MASLTIGQLREFLREFLTNESRPVETEKKNLVYGLHGIMSLLHCSHTQAQRYKDGILKDAVIQYGRKIVVDADKAIELFKKSGKCLWLFACGQSTWNNHRSFVMLAVAKDQENASTEEVSVDDAADQKPEVETPVTVGMLKIDSINDVIERAKNQEDPKDLFYGLWNEGEVACLFADSNVGKSILALQIAEKIAENQPVIYYDFEMSETQLRLRYSDETDTHKFPDMLYRGSIDPNKIGAEKFEEALINDIENSACRLKAKVIIIDNLTYMCNDSEKGDAAGAMMMKLMRLKQMYGWSLLVIAHTPKRDEKDPIEPRNLAGSKKLYNFFDTVFALGRSCQDPSYRYLKQLKVRIGEIVFGENNVLILQLDKASDGNLHYLIKGEEPEERQLGDQTTATCDEKTVAIIVSMKEAGKSFREIEKALEGISKSKAQRVYNDFEARKKAAQSARP